MGTSGIKDNGASTRSWHPKVHEIMCAELKRFLDRIMLVLPSLESARPGFVSGIQILCSLNHETENAKSLLQHCAESSKLYLAITGESIKRRFEKVHTALYLHLSQIQNMLPIPLATQITEILNNFKEVIFMVESSEEEAGKAIIAVIQQRASSTNMKNVSELEAFQAALLKLHIASPKACLMERRCLKRLLDKIQGSDPKKESIILYLLHLLKRHGNFVKTEDDGESSVKISPHSQNISQFGTDDDISGTPMHTESRYFRKPCRYAQTVTLPHAFRCPLSSEIMVDPVTIASGETYERAQIQKWFDDGHDTCPKTKMKLPHLLVIPNACLKDVISSWCVKHEIVLEDPIQSRPSTSCSWGASYSLSHSDLGSSSSEVPCFTLESEKEHWLHSDNSNISIGSYSSVNSDSTFNISCTSVTDDSFKSRFSRNCCNELLIRLSTPPLEFQHRAAEDIRVLMEEHDEACTFMLYSGFPEELLSFLKHACEVSDVKAQKTGARLFLSFVKKNRNGIPFLSDGVYHILVLLLDSGIRTEALSAAQILSDNDYGKLKMVKLKVVPSFVKILDSEVVKFMLSALGILCNLSLLGEAQSDIIASRCISKLVPLLSDSKFAANGIKILHNLANTDVGRKEMAEASGCIGVVVEMLDDSNPKTQEHAVAVLLSLCTHDPEHRQMVLKEGIIPSLVSISVNGNQNAKESALTLLRYLRGLRQSSSKEHLQTHVSFQCDEQLNKEVLHRQKNFGTKSSKHSLRKSSLISRLRTLTGT